ncbi:fatty acid desaturase FADB [Acrasis kona]|uniref:Fatty acid desaturase FADB n=1 Tax=Acrasis kona TaxID=1008807 RepID=A0AAW2YSP1_9EUKA
MDPINQGQPTKEKPIKEELQSNVTYIDGKVYDLRKFKHPGGDAAINLAIGRDATSMFHSYHPFNDKHVKILSKYKIRDELLPSDYVSEVFGKQVDDASFGDIFDWPTTLQSPFYTELRDEARKVFKVTGTKANFKRWTQILCALACVLFILPFYVKGYWAAMFLFPLAYWVLGVNTFHDASHFSLFKNQTLNHYFTHIFPAFASSHTWYHQHVIGHHQYTNTEEDPDMHHGTFLWRYTIATKHRWYFRFQIYYLFAVWSIVVFYVAFVQDIFLTIKGRYDQIRKAPQTRTQFFAQLAWRLFAAYTIYVWPFMMSEFSWFKAIAFATLPYTIFSYCFSFCSQINHITEMTVDNGQDKNWYKHQIKTSHTFCPDSDFWYIFTGGLNLQVEHHLFPGVNSIHLREIQPIVQALCEKHRIQYILSKTASEAFTKHINQLVKVSNLQPSE